MQAEGLGWLIGPRQYIRKEGHYVAPYPGEFSQEELCVGKRT